MYEDYVKSDGKYYLTRAEYKKGQSIGTGLEKNYPALNIAKGELKYLVSLDSFYTIGVGPKENWNKMEEFTTSLPKGTYYRSFEASDGEKIKESFQNLLSDVSEKRIHSISITDTLSENVELVDGDNSVSGKLVKMKANKVEEDHVLSEAEMLSLGLKKIEAKQSYDSEKKRTVLSLTTDPEDFVLPAGYELRLVANIKPSALAYTNAAKASNLKFGEARTDLNDIFWNELRRKKGEDEKYGTSVNQKGLYTNDTASITYRKDKPGEKGGTPPTENYNKPIIHVEPVAYLRIYKAFAHTDNKIYKASTGELTELGKQLAKNIQFEIWVREKGKQKLLTTINLGDARWVNGSFSQERKFVVDGYDVTIHTLENNFKDEKNRIVDRIAFTIHNLPTTNKDYRIVEKFVDQGAIHLENPDDDEGYGFERKDNGGKTESYNPVSTKDGGNTYVFTNLYKKKKVTTRLVSIEKQVQEYGASATSQKGTNDIFEFHLVPFKYINNNKYRNYYRGEINTVVNKLSGNLNGIPKPEVKQMTVKDINGTEKKEWVMVFKLKHGQKISMELGAKDKFQVYELRKEGYEDAKATETIGEKESKTAINKYQQGSDTFFCSDPLINSGQTLTFYNPRRITPPTGLHRELAPYLISIFGFVAMAGLYISINKNRRREI